MLVQMIRPKNILEVGTFSGYSAICLAEGLDEGGMVYTFEINDEQEDFTRPWIEGSAVADKIRFIIGDAITEAPRLGVTFDMAFINGDFNLVSADEVAALAGGSANGRIQR